MFLSHPLPLLAFALLACTASLPAQRTPSTPAPIPGVPAPSETGPTGPISLDVIVSAKEGRQEAPISGLDQKDFTITDNKTQRPIVAFSPVVADSTQTPVSVTIVLDSVNITYSLLANARQQLSGYLRRDGGHLAQPTRLAVLTDKGLSVEPGYSQDGNALAAAVDAYNIGLRDIRRSSGFYGADERTELCINSLALLAKSERSRPGRKLVVYISPGWPLLSGPEVDLDYKQRQHVFDAIVNISTLLRQARITLYSADPVGAAENIGRTFYYKEYVKGASKPSQADLGHLSLQVLAEQTGGRVLAGSNDVAAMLHSAIGEANSFYQLTFDPPHAEHPNEYHQIDIHLDRPNLTVRTLQGYYDQP